MATKPNPFAKFKKDAKEDPKKGDPKDKKQPGFKPFVKKK